MNKILGSFIFILLFFVTIFITKITFAQEYFFQDEFNDELPINTLDNSRWDFYPNGFSGFATLKESGGNLITSQQTFRNRFPFLVSKNGLPVGDFSAEIKFQYTNVTPWGTGIALAEEAPQNGGTLPDVLAVNVWQDQTVPNMRIGFQGQDVYTTPVNTDPHVFKIDRIGLKYFVYLDQNLVFTSPDTTTQVKYIWMGNPTLLNFQVPNWTTFSVDYVRVTQGSPSNSPTPSPSPSATTTPSTTPIIFIPGIGGSELKVKNQTDWSQPDGHGGTFTNTYQADEKVWVNQLEAAKPGNDDYFDILKMKPDGITSEADIELTGNLFQGAYQPTIDFFANNGYTLNNNFFVFPYDWRQDLALTTPLLDQKIEAIKAQTGSQKVNIIAHSMGGLVARNYIQDPTKATKVNKLIELGVPHLGSVDYLKNLHYGGCLAGEIGPFCLLLNPTEEKDVLQNSIGGFQLSPSQKYYDFYSGSDDQHPLPFNDLADLDNNGVTEALNYDQIKTLLSGLGHNTSLFTPAETFHNIDNNLSNTNGVDVTIISGSGIPTLGQIVERNVVNIAGIKVNKKDLLTINGDRTVPLYSSSLSDPSRNLSISGNAKLYYTKQEHGSLSTNGPALNLALNILTDKPTVPMGISTTAYQLKGKQVSVHSPVDIDIYDTSGNHTGLTTNGNIDEDIPGSSYQTLDDAKFIWLPDGGQYDIKLTATGQGSFDLKIRDFKNDVNDQTTIYQDVPLTISTKAEVNLDTTSTQAPTILLDQDGNGTVDRQINATGTINGNEQNDVTSPEIQVTFNTETQNLDIAGTDNSPVQVVDLSDGLKLLKDLSGNTTKLEFEPKNKKAKDTLNLKTLSYNQDALTALPDNNFVVNYKLDKTGKIETFDQKIILEGEEKIKSSYNPVANKTQITAKEAGDKKIVIEKDGMILLKLTTKNGILEATY